MSKGSILHLFDWDRKFVLPFRDLIHEHFADGRHQFVVYGNIEPGVLPASADTVVYQKLLNNCFALSKAMHRAEKIIFHGLFSNHLFYILALQPWILKKCYWVIWGGDLYVHEVDQKDWRWKKNEFLRRLIIKRLGHFLTYVAGDYELAKKWYGASGEYHECIMYPTNVYSDIAVNSLPHSTINIQIGNSADPTNNHIEILERLLPFRDHDMCVYAPLSYGNQDYAQFVIKAGKELFSHKFKPMIEFLPYNQYLDFLAKIDIAIFNHKRQQAMGNAVTLLGLGKKLYMQKDVTPWSLFDKMGVTVFDNRKIDLALLSGDIRKNNQMRIKNFFSEGKLHKQLQNIFKDELWHI